MSSFCKEIWNNRVGKIVIIVLVLYFIYNVIYGCVGIFGCYNVQNKYKKIKNYLVEEHFVCEEQEDLVCTRSDAVMDTKVVLHTSTSNNLFKNGINRDYEFKVEYAVSHWYGTVKFTTDSYKENLVDNNLIIVDRKDGYAVFIPTKCSDEQEECYMDVNDEVHAPYSTEYDSYSNDVNDALRSFENIFTKTKIKLK